MGMTYPHPSQTLTEPDKESWRRDGGYFNIFSFDFLTIFRRDDFGLTRVVKGCWGIC